MSRAFNSLFSSLWQQPHLRLLFLGGLVWLAVFSLNGLNPESPEHRGVDITVAVDSGAEERLLAQIGASLGGADTPPVRRRLEQLADFLEIDEGVEKAGGVVESVKTLGIDKSDPVIRRYLSNLGRIALETVVEREVSVSHAEIQNYYNKHHDEFVTSETINFRHVYISDASKQGGEQALSMSGQLHNLPAGEAYYLGDIFYGGHEFSNIIYQDISALFGDKFAAELKQAPDGGWQGPLKSPFGWHLVWKEVAKPAGPLPLNVAYDQIEQALLREKRRTTYQHKLALLLDGIG